MNFDLASGLLGLFLGAILAAVPLAYGLRRRAAAAFDAGRAAREPELAALVAERRALEARLVEAAERHDQVVDRERSLSAQLAQAVAERAAQAERVRNLESQVVDRQQLLESARDQMRESFKVLATEILDDKSKKFVDQNQQQLGNLLDPLKTQLKEFRETVAQTYANEQRERGSLANEIRTLRDLNQKMSEDAINLTRALKGDTRSQGAWGELVLERLLEASGLQTPREYELQTVLKDGEDDRPRPDAIVHLPEDKDLIVDAKMSLVAYDRHCAATNETEAMLALAEHVASVKRHVDQLSSRSYSGLQGVRTLDFVLMFIPVEAAFIEAVRAEPDLYTYALSKNISLVSPSTLLATLRTVAHLWRLERQNFNAVEIAKRAAKLHDHFVALAEDLEAVGDALRKATDRHEKSLRRITQGGNGSVLLQVKSLAEMGAPAQKKLPRNLLAAAGADESTPDLLGNE